MNWPPGTTRGLGKLGEGIQCPPLAIWLEVLLKVHPTSIPNSRPYPIALPEFGRFQIAMDNALLMRSFERCHNSIPKPINPVIPESGAFGTLES
jgi:hypothetical protein